MASSQDVRFSEDKVAQGQQLTNKLWNASRLILMQADPSVRAAARPTTVEDRWNASKHDMAEALQRASSGEEALKAVDDARVYLKVCTERLEAARKKIEVRAEPEPG